MKTAAAESSITCEQVGQSHAGLARNVHALTVLPSHTLLFTPLQALKLIDTVKYGDSVVEAAVICYPWISDRDNFDKVWSRDRLATQIYKVRLNTDTARFAFVRCQQILASLPYDEDRATVKSRVGLK